MGVKFIQDFRTKTHLKSFQVSNSCLQISPIKVQPLDHRKKDQGYSYEDQKFRGQVKESVMFYLQQLFLGGKPLCPVCPCLVRSNSGSFPTSRIAGSQKSIGHKTSIKTLLIFVLAALDVVFSTTALEIMFCLYTSRLSEA